MISQDREAQPYDDGEEEYDNFITQEGLSRYDSPLVIRKTRHIKDTLPDLGNGII
jgi:hypothetical protein